MLTLSEPSSLSRGMLEAMPPVRVTLDVLLRVLKYRAVASRDVMSTTSENDRTRLSLSRSRM